MVFGPKNPIISVLGPLGFDFGAKGLISTPDKTSNKTFGGTIELWGTGIDLVYGPCKNLHSCHGLYTNNGDYGP